MNIVSSLVLILMLGFGAWYCYHIYQKTTIPALSTWIIMFIGTSISLVTYLLNSNWNFEGGILNLVDVLITILIISATLLFSPAKLAFRPFEKKYLLISTLIIMFWTITQNTLYTNLLIQVLLLISYFPTIQKLVNEKKNTESFPAWIIAFTAGILAMLPAIQSGNILPIIYVGRTLLMQGIIIFLMFHYENIKHT